MEIINHDIIRLVNNMAYTSCMTVEQIAPNSYVLQSRKVALRDGETFLALQTDALMPPGTAMALFGTISPMTHLGSKFQSARMSFRKSHDLEQLDLSTKYIELQLSALPS
jgi:hypothetical protein